MPTQPAVAPPSDLAATTWRASAPHVRKALLWVKKRGSVNAEDLVEWDRTHGQRLFDWNDPQAAQEWRQHQARVFLNRFRRVFEGMRVRAFIHIHEDAEAGIETSEYVNVETITRHPGMRAQVIDDITRRMKMLASELRLWKLTLEEQAELFSRLADAMAEKQEAA
jgi:hypothetical protein